MLSSANMTVAANNVSATLRAREKMIDGYQILAGALLHSGQICMSTERVIVVEDAVKPFTEALLRATQALASARGPGGMELARPGASRDLKELVNDAVELVCCCNDYNANSNFNRVRQSCTKHRER